MFQALGDSATRRATWVYYRTESSVPAAMGRLLTLGPAAA